MRGSRILCVVILSLSLLLGLSLGSSPEKPKFSAPTTRDNGHHSSASGSSSASSASSSGHVSHSQGHGESKVPVVAHASKKSLAEDDFEMEDGKIPLVPVSLPEVPVWNYDVTDGAHGPFHWSSEKGARLCNSGLRQSPINIVDVETDPKLSALIFEYQNSRVVMHNTGRAIRFAFSEGSILKDEKGEHELKYMEVHSPSEHKIRGISFPMELQLVHQSLTTGALTVVSVLLTEGDESRVFSRIVDAIPQSATGENPVELDDVYFNPENLFPSLRQYFTYEGSITSPPCRQGTNVHVFAGYGVVGPSQVLAFRRPFGDRGNARPMQNWNGRKVRASPANTQLPARQTLAAAHMESVSSSSHAASSAGLADSVAPGSAQTSPANSHHDSHGTAASSSDAHGSATGHDSHAAPAAHH